MYQSNKPPYQKSLILTLSVLASSCIYDTDNKNSSNDFKPDIEQGAMVAVNSEEELSYFIKQGLIEQIDYSHYAQDCFDCRDGAVGTAEPAIEPTFAQEASASESTADSSADSAQSSDPNRISNTYTLEQNVDEADIIKYNGEHIFLSDQNTVRIFKTFPEQFMLEASGQFSPSIGNSNVIDSLYLSQDKLISIGKSGSYYPVCGLEFGYSHYWQEQSFAVSIADSSKPEEVIEQWQANIDGGLIDSRRIGEHVYFFSRHQISLNDIDYAYDEETLAQSSAKIEALVFDTLIPQISINGEAEQPLFAAEDCYLGNTDTQEGHSIITSISSINIQNPEQLKTTCYVGDASGLYVSGNAAYLNSYSYETDSTRIHQFDLERGHINYAASGEVVGSVGGRSAQDFYLSEYNGDLRVISTLYTWNENGVDASSTRSVSNNDAINDSHDYILSILRPNRKSAILENIATLPNAEQPEELGKPGEQLYGVRFYQDKAYLVTFDKIDPLYVLNLENPTAPFIQGQLEIPGYSDFLHPVNDNLLLGIGKSAEEYGNTTYYQGLKLELFDISEPESPSSIAIIDLGARGSDTPIFQNRHAFTYLQNNEQQAQFSLPVSYFEHITPQTVPYDWGSFQHAGLYTFLINGLDMPSTATLSQSAKLISQDNTYSYWYYGNSERSVYHGDAIFFASEGKLWVGKYDDESVKNGPY